MNYVSNFELLGTSINVKDIRAIHHYTTFSELTSNAKENEIGLIDGYYTIDDKGKALYYVTKTAPAGNAFYKEKNNLYFVIIPFPEMSFTAFGIQPDDGNDHIDEINTVLEYCAENNVTINDINTYYCKPSGTEHRITPFDGNRIKNVTFKLCPKTPSFSQWIQIIGKSNIVFDHVTFDQNIMGNPNMVINTDSNVMSWWATFYCENIHDITFKDCTSIHQGIWFVNMSDYDNQISDNVVFDRCTMERYMVDTIPWYDNTDIFLDVRKATVTNCHFISHTNKAQTAFELHGPDSIATNNTIENYRNGIIITNPNTNSNKKSYSTNIVVHSNSIRKCVYGINIYPVSDNDFDGIEVSNNIIGIDHNYHNTVLNSWGIGTQTLIDANHNINLKNVNVVNNIITEADNPLTSSDPFAPTVYTGIGFQFNGNINNLLISGNSLNNISGIGVVISVAVTNAQNKTINKLNLINNIIDCMNNNGFPTDAFQSSAYMFVGGSCFNSAAGNNVLKSKNSLLAQILQAGYTGTNQLTILPNFTEQILNTGIIKPTINTANATSNDEMHIYIDSAGLAHINGSFTITANGNGKVMYNIPTEYCPVGMINLPDAVTINNIGELVSYAGNGVHCYVHATYRPQYNNPNKDYFTN